MIHLTFSCHFCCFHRNQKRVVLFLLASGELLHQVRQRDGEASVGYHKTLLVASNKYICFHNSLQRASSPCIYELKYRKTCVCNSSLHLRKIFLSNDITRQQSDCKLHILP